MAKAMEELPGKYREVLVLWSQGKLTEKEIAVVLDMNYSTVRVMVHRGLEKLRKLYFDIERRDGMKQDNISSKLEEAYDVYLNEQEIEIPQPDLSFLKKEEKKFMPDWRMVSKVAIIALVILVSSTGIGIWLNSDSAVATKFAVEKVFYEMSNGFFPQMKNLI